MTEKKFVVWHGTAGRTMHTPVSARLGKATTSIDGRNSAADRVGAPWLVDRDCTIYKTFEDSAWIFHLGLKGTNGRYEVIGRDRVRARPRRRPPLRLRHEHSEHGLHRPVPNYDWRGHSYFVQLDEAQVDAGIKLTLDICRHEIEPVFYYPSTTFDFPRCFQVATIVCHSNCGADKTDLCLPEWVYEKIQGAGIRLAS